MKKMAVLMAVSTMITLCRISIAETVTADPLVVTARAWPEQQIALPATVEIIFPDEMRLGVLAGISDLLDTVPGVSRSGDSPWAADISIRGLARDSVILMIDGCRVVTANDLAARMSFIHPDEIERIEILKGPVSALYGSGAIGGVVNVVTRQPVYSEDSYLRQKLRVRGGSNPDGFETRYAADVISAETYLSVSAGMRDYDSYKDGDGERVVNSQFEDHDMLLRLGHRWNDDLSTEALLQLHQGREIGIPGSGTAPLPAAADVTYEDARRVLAAVVNRWNANGRWWRDSELNIYYQQISRDVRVDNFPPASPVRELRPSGRHDSVGARWLNNFEVGEHRLAAGIETWRRELDSTRQRLLANGARIDERPLPEAWEWSYGAFVENKSSLHDAVTLTVGARADGLTTRNKSTAQWAAATENDVNWNTHAGVNWQVVERLVMRAVVAAGYRAPAIEERYQYLELGGGRIKLGDPELDAERSLFSEVGMNWYGDSLRFGLNGFVNNLRDLVSEKVEDETIIRNANVDKARIAGVEASADAVLGGGWVIDAALSYLRGSDRNSGEPLAGIAPLNGFAGVRYQSAAGWYGRLQYVVTAGQERTPEGIDSARNWKRFDAACGYVFDLGRTRHEVSAGVQNITDETYRDYLSTWRGAPYNERGRSVNAAWSIDF